MKPETNLPDQTKLAILKLISDNTSVGNPVRLSFNALSKTTNLSKDVLDSFLVELNRNRFITQYVKKGVDSFTVVLNQKGLEAVQDESFI